MTIVSIKEDCRIVDRGGVTFVGELFHGLNLPVSIHVSRWCVVDCLVQWGIVMDILGVLLGFVNNCESHE